MNDSEDGGSENQSVEAVELTMSVRPPEGCGDEDVRLCMYLFSEFTGAEYSARTWLFGDKSVLRGKRYDVEDDRNRH